MGSPRGATRLLLVFLALLAVASACFLNSCPYRRYGRNTKCAACGFEAKGICVAENKCCSSDECLPDPSCLAHLVCPSSTCRIGQQRALCITRSLCCTESGCQHSAQCA